MRAFFQSVSEAVACKGFRALAKEVPFGNFLYEVAADAWKRLREKKKEREAREEVAKMARAAAEEVKRAAEQAAREAFPKDPVKAHELQEYLVQIPATVRQTLRRPSDPTGTTVPAEFTLAGPEQLLALLPNRMSEFRPGGPLPGRAGWHLAELLGIGGFGEVWRAKHPTFASLDRAVKFCTGLTDRERTLLHEGEVIDRVMRAGTVPNVVQLLDANLTGAAPWLMYEFVPGGDLVGLVDSWRSLPPAERRGRARTAWFQIVTAVAHFHKLGVVHRDLKPANVLVNGDTLKVTDFGIGGVAAKRELEAGTHAHTSTAGRLASLARGAFTPVYASPQQKKGTPPDPRDDVYALGVIGYQMLVGDVTAERPAGKGWRRELESQGVRPAVLDILESCWDDDPGERPKDASELLERMNRIGGPVPPLPASLPVQTAPPPSPTLSPIPAPSSGAITVGCPSCGKVCTARGESAGKKVKCPYCQRAVQIPTVQELATYRPPAPNPSTAPLAPKLTKMSVRGLSKGHWFALALFTIVLGAFVATSATTSAKAWAFLDNWYVLAGMLLGLLAAFIILQRRSLGTRDLTPTQAASGTPATVYCTSRACGLRWETNYPPPLRKKVTCIYCGRRTGMFLG